MTVTREAHVAECVHEAQTSVGEVRRHRETRGSMTSLRCQKNQKERPWMEQRRPVLRVSTRNWMDRRKREKPVIHWVPMITHTIAARSKGTDTSESSECRGIQMIVLEKATIHTIPNSTQQFKKDTGLQPLVLRISPIRSSSSSSKNRSSSTALVFKSLPSNLAGRDSWPDETWQTWWTTTTSGILGHLGAEANGARHLSQGFFVCEFFSYPEREIGHQR